MIVFLVSPYLQFYPYTSNVDLRSFISKEFYAIYSAWFNQTEIVQRNYPQNLCITPILFELTSSAELWQKIERVVQSTTEELSNYQRRKVIVWSWTVVPTSYIFNIRADLSIFGKCGGAIKISSTSDMFKSGGRWRHFCWYPPKQKRSEKERRRLEEEVSECQLSTCGWRGWSQLKEGVQQKTNNKHHTHNNYRIAELIQFAHIKWTT